MKATDSCIELAMDLIRKPSVTPFDAGCQKMLSTRLQAAGFSCEQLDMGGVSNLWARCGKTAPLVCLAGHTDVVPTGDPAAWDNDPFEPLVKNGQLYGRGAADMKGGLAAMIVAAEEFVVCNPGFKGSIAFLVTSDEEGDAVYGTRYAMEELVKRGEQIDYCIVGEPSSSKTPGDCVRIGRRGSLTGRLKIAGIQGHVAYAHLAENPIRTFSPALHELTATKWDDGNDQFPATTFELTHLLSSSGADNVIPAELEATFNFRYSTEWNAENLRRAVEKLLTRHGFAYKIDWHLSGEPFLTQSGALTDATEQAIREVTGMACTFSTGGGTSDGRFIAPTGADVIEIGLCNESIHQVNERVNAEHLPLLKDIYRRTLELLLS